MQRTKFWKIVTMKTRMTVNIPNPYCPSFFPNPSLYTFVMCPPFTLLHSNIQNHVTTLVHQPPCLRTSWHPFLSLLCQTYATANLHPVQTQTQTNHPRT